MLQRNKRVIFNGKPSALPRYYEDKVFDTEELKKARKAEKKAYCTVEETDIEAIQRNANISARYNLKRKETNFDKDIKFFEETNVLVDHRCSID